jgi:hypothetical protein
VIFDGVFCDDRPRSWLPRCHSVAWVLLLLARYPVSRETVVIGSSWWRSAESSTLFSSTKRRFTMLGVAMIDFSSG